VYAVLWLPAERDVGIFGDGSPSSGYFQSENWDIGRQYTFIWIPEERDSGILGSDTPSLGYFQSRLYMYILLEDKPSSEYYQLKIVILRGKMTLSEYFQSRMLGYWAVVLCHHPDTILCRV
jgi:hypothetical protein